MRNKNTPEFYYINQYEHPLILANTGRIASLEEVRILMESCQFHLGEFENEEEVNAENLYHFQQAEAERAKWRESKQANKPEKKWQDDISTIYLMLNKKTGRVKIGISSNPTFREKTLQEEVPDIELFHTGAGSWNDEQSLHTHFHHKRLRGEWFDLTAEEIEEAKQIITDLDAKNRKVTTPTPPICRSWKKEINEYEKNAGCPNCSGHGKIFTFHGVDLGPCDMCLGTGEITPEQQKWRVIGRGMKNIRIKNRKTILAAAQELGINAVELSKMERGVIQPKLP